MPANVVVPEVGESIVDARVAKWLKKEGDAVNVGEPLVELETDKIDLEVAAPQAGVLGRIAHGDGADVKVGDVLGVIEDGRPQPSGRGGRESRRSRRTSQPRSGASPRSAPAREAGTGRRREAADAEKTRVTPAARNAAQQNDVDLAAGPRQRRRRPRHEARRRSQPPRGRRPRRRPSGKPRAPKPAHAGPRRAPACRRRSHRRARAHVEAARHDRQAAGRGAEHRRDAHDLQRGRHDRRDGGARAPQAVVQGALRRRPRPHLVLRQGRGRRAARLPAHQRRDPGRRDGAEALLRHRRRRRRERRARRPRAARRRPHVVRRRSSRRCASSPRRPRTARCRSPI